MPDISAILTAHREGILVGISLKNMLEAVEHARSQGMTVEILAMLDRPDDATRAVLDRREDLGLRTFEVDFGDQGKVRNHAVQLAKGNFVAFLDGDDLWSFNWLTAADKIAQEDPEKTVVHPAFNWFFEGNSNIFAKVDIRDEYFDPEFLRFGNYWDALFYAKREIYLDYPFCDRELEAGYAFEDWHWNCMTLEDGFKHYVAPNTVHFKRRRKVSQNIHSTRRKALVRPTKIFRYDWYDKGEQSP